MQFYQISYKIKNGNTKTISIRHVNKDEALKEAEKRAKTIHVTAHEFKLLD
jgi:cell fate (sporulation/competence/biofilm development) regulator YmcA (YheA/YmcA/DUF963 family)